MFYTVSNLYVEAWDSYGWVQLQCSLSALLDLKDSNWKYKGMFHLNYQLRLKESSISDGYFLQQNSCFLTKQKLIWDFGSK